MVAPLNPTTFRFPFELKDQPPEVRDAHRYAFSGLLDLNQAIASLKTQVDSAKSVATKAAATTNTVTTTVVSILAGLGTINDQTGQTSYVTQTQDGGALLILNDASAIAISLNSVVATPYALFITNSGAGTATLTPTSGLVNGGASMTLITNQTIWIAFDGVNWKSQAIFAPPQNTPAISHEFVTAYAAATGVFTQAQPAFTDISGTIQAGQILSGTSASLGGSAMTAGQRITVTVTITGATTTMVSDCSPQTDPGAGFVWHAFVGAANTVTVCLTCVAAGTPTASLYSVRVLP